MNQNDQMREQFERFKQDERTWNYAEALYWMNQYKNLIEQALAIEPALDAAELVQLAKDVASLPDPPYQEREAGLALQLMKQHAQAALAKFGGTS